MELHVFGPHFGLPDASPFCVKALMLMKMSGLPHDIRKMSFRQAPKGKAPYLVDGDAVIADSFFLARHLEAKHGADFSGGYAASDLARGWATARMLEEHFYFLMVNIRWLHDGNFWKGPYQFFADAPAPLRPLIARIVRKKVRRTAGLQGLGRHTAEERLQLAKGDILAVENMLGSNRYFLGDRVSEVDATIVGSLWSASTTFFESDVADFIRSRPVLMAYLERMAGEFFPGFKV